MRLPRWTVYPALALLAAMLLLAFPGEPQDAHEGAAQRARQGAEANGSEPRAPSTPSVRDERDERPAPESARGPDADGIPR